MAPSTSPANRISRRLARPALLVAAVLTVGAGVLAVNRLNEARQAGRWVNHAHEALDAVHELRGAIAAIDAAQHALIQLAPEASDSNHRARAAAALSNARAALVDSAQHERLDTLERLMHEKLAELSATLSLIQQGAADSARAVIRDDETEARNDRITALLGRLNAHEHDRMRERTDLQTSHAAGGRVLVGLALAASLVLAGAGAWLLRREERRARFYAGAAEAAAQAARQSEARFRTALDAMLDAFYIARPVFTPQGTIADFEIVEANEAGAVLAGVSAERLRGALVSSALPIDRADSLPAVCGRVVETGERHSEECSLPHRPDAWIRLQIVRTNEGVALTCHDITANKRAEAELSALAVRDELTGLLNRRGFRELAEQELKVARRTGRRDAVVSLDLSGFKQINDAFGHAEGDAAIRAVARVLSNTLREADVLGRIGGDEFVVYAPAAGTAQEAARLASRLADAFTTANDVARAAARPYTVSTAIGFAVFEDDDTLDLMLARADVALYAQKRRLATLATT